MLRIPHCLDNRLTDGGKVVSLKQRPNFTPQKHYLYVSGTHFCYRLSKPQGLYYIITITILIATYSTHFHRRRFPCGLTRRSVWAFGQAELKDTYTNLQPCQPVLGPKFGPRALCTRSRNSRTGFSKVHARNVLTSASDASGR
jgi:hypothetical protein